MYGSVTKTKDDVVVWVVVFGGTSNFFYHLIEGFEIGRIIFVE
jgi:hypothetical protein